MPRSDLFESQICKADDVQKFIFAGRALFTIVSKKTGNRFTYRVNSNRKERPNRIDKPIQFVQVLSGPDNESSYSYLGYLNPFTKQKLNAGKKGKPDALSFKSLNWLLEQLSAGKLPEQIEFYHAGKCGACGRTLTVPESIETGLGPICAGKHNV